MTIQALLEGIVYSYLVYYLFNTVVHPWYLITSLGVSILTNSKTFLVWSYLVFLSYFTYSTPGYQESTLLLFVQYTGVIIAILCDLKVRRITKIGENIKAPEKSL